MEEANLKIKVKADTKELEKVTEKAKELVRLLQEAKELIDSIASTKLDIRIDAELDGNSAEWARITG